RTLERALGRRQRVLRVERNGQEPFDTGPREVLDDVLDERRGAVHRGADDGLVSIGQEEPLDSRGLFFRQPPDRRASADRRVKLARGVLAGHRDRRRDRLAQQGRLDPDDVRIREEPVEEAGNFVEILRASELAKENRPSGREAEGGRRKGGGLFRHVPAYRLPPTVSRLKESSRRRASREPRRGRRRRASRDFGGTPGRAVWLGSRRRRGRRGRRPRTARAS